jgi:general secretion pathway protein O
MLGGCLGSFASMLIYRLPRLGESINIFYPKSFCPECRVSLTILQLIPFVGYFLNKGKCKSCKEKINLTYLINELILTLLFLYIVHVMSIDNLMVFAITSIVFILYVQSLIDFKMLLLSQPLSYMLAILGLSLNISLEFFTVFVDSMLGFIFGYGILFCINLLHKMIRKINGIGSGDFMLMGSLGALFGASAIGPILLVGSSITLSLYAIKKDNMNELPLGFGLGLAGIVYCLIFISI